MKYFRKTETIAVDGGANTYQFYENEHNNKHLTIFDATVSVTIGAASTNSKLINLHATGFESGGAAIQRVVSKIIPSFTSSQSNVFTLRLKRPVQVKTGPTGGWTLVLYWDDPDVKISRIDIFIIYELSFN